MKRPDVQFVLGAASLDQVPREQLPHVAFLGPSNVGKSSLINMLLAQDVARVSKTPGRTQQLNFFRIDQSFLVVDLPGYGYAKAPKDVQRGFLKLIEAYLASEPRLAVLVLLLDCRRDPSQHDIDLKRWLDANDVPNLVAVTKVDKLSRSEVAQRLAATRRVLGPGAAATWMQPTSSETGLGRKELWTAIETHVVDTRLRIAGT